MHKKIVANIIARIFFIVSGFMLFPLIWAGVADLSSIEVNAFLFTIFLGIGVSFFLRTLVKVSPKDFETINAKDGLAIVGLSWIFLSVFGALPLFLSGAVSSYTDAIFEIVSGFTTTGATIITDIEGLPRGILFWRSLTHWLGGMGIIVLYVALLPALGISAFRMYQAEAPGITVERLDPRIKETAKTLWGVYFLLSLSETVCLMAGGMPLFDALCHTFGTMATGGFSTQTASIGAYGPYIQWVIIFFMIMAGCNFMLHFYALKGRPLNYFKNEEFRYYLFLILGVSIFSFFVLRTWTPGSVPFRTSMFQVVSVLTTTGYVTTDFDVWPQVLRFGLVCLMFIGGCGGSTGGGMKIVRFFLSVKIALRSMIQAILPNAVLPVRFNNNVCPPRIVLSVLAYFVIYVLLLFLGAMAMTITERCDLVTALTASMATLSNIGPGLGRVGAVQNYAWISVPGKWILTFLMLAGRLELYSILILFVPSAWKK